MTIGPKADISDIGQKKIGSGYNLQVMSIGLVH